MRYLVTGGCGYIGSVLVNQLVLENNKVRVLDNLTYTGEGILQNFDSIDFIQGDVRDAETCIESVQGVEAVVHLAAIVGEGAAKKNPELTKETNLYATRQLWEIARDAGVKTFTFASTCSNYGKAELATEETELNPLGLYAETKVDAEKWLLAQPGNKMTTIILRFATAFGLSPRMRWDLLINQFVLDSFLHKKLSIYNPNAQRPYCHVRDISRMLIRTTQMASKFNKFNRSVFNIGGYNKSKLEIAEMVKEQMPCLKIETVETGGGRDYAVSFRKIRGFGIVPRIEPKKGIDALVRSLPLFDSLSAEKWKNS